jgi:hypothetical protein
VNRPRRQPWRPAISRKAVRSAFFAGLVTWAAAVCLTSCAAGSSPTAAPTTASSNQSGSTTSVPVDPSGRVLSAYRAMWADLVSAARTSNFQSPRLSQHATGQALTLFVQGLARDQLHGIVTRGTPVLHPMVTSLSPERDPSRATVGDCFDDTHWLEYQTTGKLAKNAPGGRRATTAQLINTSGAWKVDQITIGKPGTC